MTWSSIIAQVDAPDPPPPPPVGPWDIVRTDPIWSVAVIGTVFIVAGAVATLGMALYHRTDEAQLTMREAVAGIIVTTWLMSTMAQIVVPGYQVSIYLNGLMGAVAGWLFGMNKRVRLYINGEADDAKGGKK